ncbi:hypothetical protein AU198_19075 [Mycobacterium sp. GA-1199]|nr:hypothetical protein AU198_19075 [Mycobacterium sp. GA-1199]
MHGYRSHPSALRNWTIRQIDRCYRTLLYSQPSERLCGPKCLDRFVDYQFVLIARFATHYVHCFDEPPQSRVVPWIRNTNRCVVIDDCEFHRASSAPGRIDHARPEIPRQRFCDEVHGGVDPVRTLHSDGWCDDNDGGSHRFGVFPVGKSEFASDLCRILAEKRLGNTLADSSPPVTPSVRATFDLEGIPETTRE